VWRVTVPWADATADLTPPLAAVDLDAFDANAAAMVRRAHGLPIRVASKSVRCRALLRRALETDGFRGVMAYAAAEALWLQREGVDDLFVAYPSVDRPALAAIAGDARAADAITLAVDDPAHLDLLAGLGPHRLRVAIDVDASLRIGPPRMALHLGVRRSPLRSPEQVADLARQAQRAGLRVVGLMFYDAQIAGLPDSSPVVRLVKRASDASLRRRRAEVTAAVREVTDLQFVNGGGTGSLHVTGADPTLTELAGGSGLYGPTLFDGYRAFTPRPAAAYALPVVRRPGRGFATAFGGGYVASGAPGWSRVPSPVDAALRLVRTEAAGEVQTPLRGRAADRLRIGDRVWMRHAKAGELAERFETFHLVSGGRLVESVPTYRGEGRCFG